MKSVKRSNVDVERNGRNMPGYIVASWEQAMISFAKLGFAALLCLVTFFQIDLLIYKLFIAHCNQRKCVQRGGVYLDLMKASGLKPGGMLRVWLYRPGT